MAAAISIAKVRAVLAVLKSFVPLTKAAKAGRSSPSETPVAICMALMLCSTAAICASVALVTFCKVLASCACAAASSIAALTLKPATAVKAVSAATAGKKAFSITKPAFCELVSRLLNSSIAFSNPLLSRLEIIGMLIAILHLHILVYSIHYFFNDA